MPEHRAHLVFFAQRVFFAQCRNNVLGKPQGVARLIHHTGCPGKRRRFLAFAQLVQIFPAKLHARRHQINRRIFVKSVNQLFDKPRRANRVIALQIDNQIRTFAKFHNRFANTVGTGFAGVAGNHTLDSVRLTKILNPFVFRRRHDSRIRSFRPFACRLNHPEQHLFAGDFCQRLAGKTRRAVTRRNNNQSLNHLFFSCSGNHIAMLAYCPVSDVLTSRTAKFCTIRRLLFYFYSLSKGMSSIFLPYLDCLFRRQVFTHQQRRIRRQFIKSL